jgi:hypothetical protein
MGSSETETTERADAVHQVEISQPEGRRAALRSILPVLDALERALAAGSSDLSFLEGVDSTYRLFLSALAEAGAQPIPALGRPFDPLLHEAVSYETTRDCPPNTVAREVRRGWRLGDEIIRPSAVVVGMGATDSRSRATLSAQELAAIAGITDLMLTRVVRLGLVEPLEPGGREFPATCAPRLQRMLRLRLELGLNLAGAAVVLDLLERLARLEAELGRLRARSSRALEAS